MATQGGAATSRAQIQLQKLRHQQMDQVCGNSHQSHRIARSSSRNLRSSRVRASAANIIRGQGQELHTPSGASLVHAVVSRNQQPLKAGSKGKLGLAKLPGSIYHACATRFLRLCVEEPSKPVDSHYYGNSRNLMSSVSISILDPLAHPAPLQASLA